ASSKPPLQSPSPPPSGTAAPRPRIAAGLPPQPPPVASTKNGLRSTATGGGSAKGATGLNPASSTLSGKSAGGAGTAAAAKAAIGRDAPASGAAGGSVKPELPKDQAKPDAAIPDRPKSGKVATASDTPELAVAATAPPSPATTRVVVGAGEP